MSAPVIMSVQQDNCAAMMAQAVEMMKLNVHVATSVLLAKPVVLMELVLQMRTAAHARMHATQMKFAVLTMYLVLLMRKTALVAIPALMEKPAASMMNVKKSLVIVPAPMPVKLGSCAAMTMCPVVQMPVSALVQTTVK